MPQHPSGGGGHDVTLPAEYFGGVTNNYVSAKEAAILEKNATSAYGNVNATSHGRDVGQRNFAGGHLAPFPNASPLQTGGRRGALVQTKALLRRASQVVHPFTARNRAKSRVMPPQSRLRSRQRPAKMRGG